MNRIFIYIMFSGMTLMAGCMLGSDYERPELNLPDEFRQQTSEHPVGVSEGSLAFQNFRDLLTDPDLIELIEIGLENNLDLAVARSRLIEARAQLAVSRSPLFPELKVESGTAREKESAITQSSNSTENTSYLDGLLSWEIDLWGKHHRGVESSEANMKATAFNRQAITVSLIAEIASTYTKLQDTDNRLEISERTVATRQESVRIARLRKKGGVISKLEVQQAEVELASAKTIIPLLINNQMVQENQLNILLGMPPGSISRTKYIRTMPPEVPIGLPATLLQQRPDIMQAEQNIISANAGIGIAEAAFYPSFVLTGAYGRESYQMSNVLKTSGETWTMAIDAAMPVFNAGRNKANLVITKEIYEQACSNYRHVVLRALKEVSDALSLYSLSKDVLETHSQLVDASTEYVRLANLQYFNGILSYLDLLDAQRQLFDAELSLSEARRDRFLSIVFLYKSLGAGWDASESPHQLTGR